jgi:sec-independent protein translocase protein TatA
MFGTLGVPEMIMIFLVGLLLFGPKKLPELGRTVGKAMTEFRRASNDLKQTFDREMKTLEQETESLKAVGSQYQYDTYNYDYSSYETNPEHSYSLEGPDSTANPSTEGASATEGAEAPSGIGTEDAASHSVETAVSPHYSGEYDGPVSDSPEGTERLESTSPKTEQNA